jgi:FeS assembly SUF system protein
MSGGDSLESQSQTLGAFNMGQDDVFKRKRLTVLNRAAPPRPSQYVLEDSGEFVGVPAEGVDPLESRVVATLRGVRDPEIPLNIYDLGLVYRVDVGSDGRVEIDMTLTSPGCPVAGVLVRQVHDAVRKVPGVSTVRTELVWEPSWTQDRMSVAAKLSLGLL